jgi:hypothetical protein
MARNLETRVKRLEQRACSSHSVVIVQSSQGVADDAGTIVIVFHVPEPEMGWGEWQAD